MLGPVAGTARLLPSVGRPANCRNVPCRAHRATLPTEAAFRRPPTPCGSSRGEIYCRKAHFQLAIDAHALKVAKRGQEGLRRRAQRRSCESCRRRCVSAVATRTRHEPSSSKRDFPSRMRPTWQVAIRRSFSSWLLRRPLAIAMSTKPAFVSSNFPPIDANSFRAITAHAPFTRLMAYQRFPAACCAKR